MGTAINVRCFCCDCVPCLLDLDRVFTSVRSGEYVPFCTNEFDGRDEMVFGISAVNVCTSKSSSSEFLIEYLGW